MRKAGLIMCVMSMAAIGALHAGQLIEVEKLTKAQLDAAMKAAPDDAMIEYQGQSKTKAQWSSEFQARFNLQGIAKARELAASGSQARLQAAAKAVQDEQNKSIAAQNAQVEKEFDDLSSQP
jgi:hypothetical protein